MTRLKALAGVVMLSALVMCAVGAGSASATTLHVCTAEKLNEETTPKFEDSACRKPNEGSGTFHLTRLNVGVAIPTMVNATTNHTFAGTIAGVKFAIVCEGLTGTGSYTNNIDKNGVMRVEASALKFEYTKCKVEEPAGKGCVVPEAISTKTLKAATQPMTEAEATKVRVEPETGETFMAVTVKSCTVSALNGEKIVKGFAEGVVPEEERGALEFSTKSGSGLTLEGSAATYTGKVASVKEETTEPLVIAKP
jgi:hypothetical protein